MQYYILKATEYGDTFATYEEALKASTDKNKMEQDDQRRKQFRVTKLELLDYGRKSMRQLTTTILTLLPTPAKTYAGIVGSYSVPLLNSVCNAGQR
jgi:hypothetical protein